MLKLKKKENSKSVGLAIRVVARAPYGAKASHKLLPSEIVNRHWAVADEFGQVAYTTNTVIDQRRNGNVDKVFLFANSCGETFLCEADVDAIFSSESEFIPSEVNPTIQVPEWKNEAQKTWLILSNFKQLDIASCNNMLLYKNEFLRDKIFGLRFRNCYVEL